MRMAHRFVGLIAVFSWLICAGGCDLVLCKAPPTESHGACDPNLSTCDGGPADPAPDTIIDVAVDIGVFAPDDVPARVVLRVPNEGRLHVADDVVLSYLARPPASGPHFVEPAETGYYCQPLNAGHWVHSLEHGYCVLLFDENNPTAAAAKSLLSLMPQFFPPSPNFGEVKLVVTPFNNMVHPFCMVTWNRQFYLDEIDLTAMTNFYTNYIDRGPEFIP